MTMSWPKKSIIVIPYSTEHIVVRSNDYKLAKKPTILLEINVFVFSNSIKYTRKDLENFLKDDKKIPCIFLVNEGDIDKMKGFLELLGFKKNTKKDLPNLHEIKRSVEDYNSNIRLDSNKLLIMRSKMMDFDKVKKYLNDISQQNNGVDHVLIISGDSSGILVSSNAAGKDGKIDSSALQNGLAPLSTLKKSIEEQYSLKEQFKELKYFVLGFEDNTLVATFANSKSDNELIMIIFVNIDSKKREIARKIARNETPKIAAMM